MRRLPLDASTPSRSLPGFPVGDIRASAGPILTFDLHAALMAAKYVGPTLGTALVAWITGRSGRKVRVKVDGIEVEAGSAKEVERLLTKAQKVKQDNEPRRIHER